MARRRKRRPGGDDHPGVTLLRPTKARPYYSLRWIDAGGVRRQQSTRVQSELAARQAAAALSRRVQSREIDTPDITWHGFCERYEREHLALGARSSMAIWKTARKWYTNLMGPQFLAEVTTSTISRFTGLLRVELEKRNGKARETTIASYLRHLRAALNYAEWLGLLEDPIKVRIPRRAKGPSKLARSRPVTGEEFERILGAVPKVRPKDHAQWEWFLAGLWESGLRLAELAQLSWDPVAPICFETRGRYPFIRFAAAAEKAHTDRLQPVTPEFWALVDRAPAHGRNGRVFPLRDRRGRQYGVDWIGRVISQIGRRAGVQTDLGQAKCATSHDIGRRALTTRLESRLTEAEVAEWMRHQDVETTRRYYYVPAMESLAERLWSAQGDG